MNPQDLQQIIKDAFALVPHPHEDDITSHRCYECDEVRESFKDVVWNQADKELLDNHNDSLPLFNAAAYHHFLPAYLIRALDEDDNKDEDDGRHGNLYASVIYSLSTVPPFNMRDSKVLPFSSAQIQAIILFLEFQLSEEESSEWWDKDTVEAIAKWRKLLC